MDKDSLIEYPCYFPIKIIGEDTYLFRNHIAGIVSHHFPNYDLETITYHQSAKGNYVAITIKPFVENQEKLDAIYLALTQYPGVKMVF
jgi:uncharacterized protein